MLSKKFLTVIIETTILGSDPDTMYVKCQNNNLFDCSTSPLTDDRDH
jgi:hypothetical protein